MDATVFAAVLFAAACHAGWNAAIKRGGEPLATATLISIGAAVVAAVLVPLAGLPQPASWPYAAASVVIQLGYLIALVESYRAGDFGQVYPIARGCAPLLTAIAATVLIAEPLALAGWFGIVLLAAGVLLLSLRGGRDLNRFNARAVGFALATAVTICTYTVVDGVGARLSGNPAAYALVLFVGLGPVMAAYAVLRDGAGVLQSGRSAWAVGVAGGALQIISYGIAVWGMTVAPIALVAALRETSVLFAAIIAVVLLKEPLRASRIVAAVMIAVGVALIRTA
jgi:drug/metabolite transporter (DMT)-like permease